MQELSQIYHIFSEALTQYDIIQTTQNKENQDEILLEQSWKESPLEIELMVQYERICVDYSIDSAAKKSNKVNSSSFMGTFNWVWEY